MFSKQQQTILCCDMSKFIIVIRLFSLSATIFEYNVNAFLSSILECLLAGIVQKFWAPLRQF